MASLMAAYAGQSLPKQMGRWPDLKAAYRFLNNDRAQPDQIGAAHRAWTRRQCVGHKVVLLMQDDTDLQGVKVAGGRGGQWGEVLHTTLAVTPGGELLGIMDQRWFEHIAPIKGETQAQRAARWRESDVWADAVKAVARQGDPPPGCRYIHVADRASDNLRFMHACLEEGHGFVLRAKHDRRVEENTATLWEHLGNQPAAGSVMAKIGVQRDKAGKVTRQGRAVNLSVRYATVRLERPWNHPTDVEPLTVQAVYLKEEDPPQGIEPVDWMLLTSEPVASFEEACVIASYYQQRWVIEEWHRCLKEGCKLEQSQVQTIEALRRLSALLSVIAVRLLRLRDLAESQKQSDPQTLQASVPWTWIVVVALLAQAQPETFSAREFWLTIARQGGFIGRKRDGRPGWKVIWRGWYDISQMVRYAELRERSEVRLKSCG
jgi:Transposase Tn5 dimerisation domain